MIKEKNLGECILIEDGVTTVTVKTKVGVLTLAKRPGRFSDENGPVLEPLKTLTKWQVVGIHKDGDIFWKSTPSSESKALKKLAECENTATNSNITYAVKEVAVCEL